MDMHHRTCSAESVRPLLVLADVETSQRAGRTVAETLHRALSGQHYPEVMVVLRNKSEHPNKSDLPLDVISALCKQSEVRVLGHSHCHLNSPEPLNGMHFASDHPLDLLRATRKRFSFQGRSCHITDAPETFTTQLCDYVTLSPIFRPTSKPTDRRDTLGLSSTAQWVHNCMVPVFALGGMQPHHYRQSIEAGFSGIAVLGGIMGAEDPAHALQSYVKVIRQLKGRG